MTRNDFEKMTLEVIESDYEQRKKLLKKFMKNVDRVYASELIDAAKDNYFLPKALFEAMNYKVIDKAKTPSFTISFVKKHFKAVRDFQSMLLYI